MSDFRLDDADGLTEAGMRRMMDWLHNVEVGQVALSGDVVMCDLLAYELERRDTPCVWTEDQDTDSWDTSCGKKWHYEYDGPVENGVKFCAGCGHPVKIARRALDGGDQ